MKQLLICFFSFITFSCCFSQSDERFIIDLKQKQPQTKNLIPFSDIKILDSRYDQSNIGCIVKRLSFQGMSEGKTEAVFPDSLKTYLPDVLKNILQLSPSIPDTLAILIKRFRMVDYLTNEGPNRYEPQILLTIAASFYTIKDGRYHKIFSIDGILSQPFDKSKPINKKNIADLRADALLELLSSIFKNKKWQSSTVSFSNEEVGQGLNKRFDLPILKDTSVYLGIYQNFDDFKNNSPSIRKVKPIFRKKTFIELRDSNNKKIDVSEYWGLSDGRKNYIVFRGNFYELFKSDRSFKFTSYRQKDDFKGNPSYGDYATELGTLPAFIIKSGQHQQMPEDFYLNMDTGEIYLEEIFGRSGLSAMQKEILR